ncbi:MAG: hypothetical protein KDB80_06015, partial [Planctomycetes bacterium]|nr:hypothetical protein [Planctomycetota bacterium]
ELERVREDLEAVGVRVRDLEANHERAAEAVADLREIRRRFRKRDFDSDESRFDSRFDFGAIAADILSGALVLGDAWGRVKRRQRFRRRHTSDGASAAIQVLGNIVGSLGSSSNSRGGGFGGFGGGGFRTGGGFGGGGGGFRTGGGF